MEILPIITHCKSFILSTLRWQIINKNELHYLKADIEGKNQTKIRQLYYLEISMHFNLKFQFE